MGRRYKYTNELRKTENKGKVILSNRKTGNWLCVSSEVKLYIDKLIYEHLDVESFYNYFEEKDQIFIKKVVDNLIKMQLICGESSVPSYDYRKDFTFSITKRCNLQCKHCSYAARKEEEITNELNLKGIINILDAIIRENPTSITITGGEPMIRQDFEEICNYLNKIYSGQKILMTNGTLINKRNVDCIINTFNSIDISIDGINEKTCSEIRGKGVFERVISAINILQDKRFYDIALSMVIVGRNEHLLYDFKEMCKILKVRAVPRAFIVKGRGKENMDYLSKDVASGIKHDNKSIDITRNQMTAIKCQAGIDEFFIDANGDVFPCSLLCDEEYKLFNILLDNKMFGDYFTINQGKSTCNKLLVLEPENNFNCKDCNINQFCSSCPAYFGEYRHDKEMLEAWCNYNKSVMEDLIWGN